MDASMQFTVSLGLLCFRSGAKCCCFVSLDIDIFLVRKEKTLSQNVVSDCVSLHNENAVLL